MSIKKPHKGKTMLQKQLFASTICSLKYLSLNATLFFFVCDFQGFCIKLIQAVLLHMAVHPSSVEWRRK